jgi:LytS/YehU family sensor histidine kinase
MTHSLTLTKSVFKNKILVTAAAIVSAVALPQIFHLIGAASGLGVSPGETFLPMHLPVLLAGLLFGPMVGAFAGAISPLLSYTLTGMPFQAMLPFMVTELTVYGLVAGWLSSVDMNLFVKILMVQISGRVARFLAIAIAVYAFGSNMNITQSWSVILSGLPGIILQWSLLPLLIFWLKNTANK